MTDRLVPLADGFWNLRGSFRVGPLDIGTQASLARLGDASFALLDSYPLRGAVGDEVLALTDGGRAVQAILNLHPFHTVFVRAAHQALPHAALHGTRRHVEKAPDLPWQPLHTEHPDFHAAWSSDFAFSVPRGVHFVSENENLHFSSVLALHRASRTLHVDDTLSYTSLPFVGGLAFHPTLGQVLERRPGAAADFRAWAAELIALCSQVEHLCTAHLRELPPDSPPVVDQVRQALVRAERTLRHHERRHG